MPSAPRQQPGFQSSVATRPLSNNPFEQTPSHDLTPAGLMSAYNNRKSDDDSLMVDNLFAAMGTADSDGEDLLSALNSVSLGLSASQHTTRSNNWDYKIPGWGEDDVGSHSRLEDYRD